MFPASLRLQLLLQRLRVGGLGCRHRYLILERQKLVSFGETRRIRFCELSKWWVAASLLIVETVLLESWGLLWRVGDVWQAGQGLQRAAHLPVHVVVGLMFILFDQHWPVLTTSFFLRFSFLGASATVIATYSSFMLPALLDLIEIGLSLIRLHLRVCSWHKLLALPRTRVKVV